MDSGLPSMKNSSDLKSETSLLPVAVASNATVPATVVPSQSMVSSSFFPPFLFLLITQNVCFDVMIYGKIYLNSCSHNFLLFCSML